MFGCKFCLEQFDSEQIQEIHQLWKHPLQAALLPIRKVPLPLVQVKPRVRTDTPKLGKQLSAASVQNNKDDSAALAQVSHLSISQNYACISGASKSVAESERRASRIDAHRDNELIERPIVSTSSSSTFFIPAPTTANRISRVTDKAAKTPDTKLLVHKLQTDTDLRLRKIDGIDYSSKSERDSQVQSRFARTANAESGRVGKNGTGMRDESLKESDRSLSPVSRKMEEGNRRWRNNKDPASRPCTPQSSSRPRSCSSRQEPMRSYKRKSSAASASCPGGRSRQVSNGQALTPQQRTEVNRRKVAMGKLDGVRSPPPKKQKQRLRSPSLVVNECAEHAKNPVCGFAFRAIHECRYGARCFKKHPQCPQGVDCRKLPRQCSFDHLQYCRQCSLQSNSYAGDKRQW